METITDLPFKTGRAMLLFGILAIILGVVMIAWPSATLEIALIALGILCLIGGVIQTFMGLQTMGMGLVSGVLFMVIGVVLIVVPHFAADFMVYLFAVFLIILGLSLIMGMGLDVSGNKTVTTVVGAIMILMAILFIIFPEETILIGMWVVGAVLIIIGILLAIDGWRCRSITFLD